MSLSLGHPNVRLLLTGYTPVFLEDGLHALMHLDHGIYFYPGRLGWLSGAHSEENIAHTLAVARTVMEELVAEGLPGAG